MWKDRLRVAMEHDEKRPTEGTVIEATALRQAATSPTLAATSLWLARRMFGLRVSPPTQVESDDALELRPAPGNRPSAYLLSLIVCVVVPSIACALYLAFIASDQYVAEVRFAVKTAQYDSDRQKKSDGTGVASGASIPSIANQEAYIISDYVRSRGIVDDLSKTIDLHDLFRRPEADFWARLRQGASVEKLVDYWKGMVRTYVDGPSGIVTVEARAFRPEDALALGRAIIEASEKLANDVSARMRRDTMKMAEDEVRKSEGSVETALRDMRKFRDEQGFIDPIASANSTSKLLMQMMGEKIRLQSDYFVATKAMSAEAPTVVTLKTRLDSLEGQIDDLKSKLTGDSKAGATISAALVKFEALELQRRFAEKMYELAQDSLERAREKAERQSVYIEVFVPPALPEEAKYPERILMALLIPVGLLIVWGIFALTAAAVDDHRY
jgi:capsular polysaccharide transport system permease protein